MKANNVRVLGDGSKPGDRDHMSVTTPTRTKRKALQNDPQFKADAMDRERESAVTKARRGRVRPLGGNGL